MRLEDFDFHLPDAQIARFPADRREDARLLVFDRKTGERAHRTVRDLPGLLGAGDLLVTNDVRVARARLHFRRASGAAIEGLALRWDGRDLFLLANGRGRLRAGERLAVEGDPPASVTLVAREHEGWRAVVEPMDAAELVERCGRVPLPPYIRKARKLDGVDEATAEPLDRDRYQTVFARGGVAVAAPTAGLHLTERLFSEAAARGVEHASVRLHVGPGTFAPIRTANLDEHRMESERFEIEARAFDAIAAARAQRRRVVAVGTTVVRTLESAVAADGSMRRAGETALFIRPGFEFRAVGALLTNFHLPQSTLLMLVCAFAGREATLALYEEAVREKYRFYSYGDAMFIM